MMTRSLLCGLCVLFGAGVAQATPVLTVGTPGNDQLSTPTKPSPSLGGVTLNFDSLAAGATYTTYTASGVSVSSADGLTVLPYSTQSGPNELYDASADGSAQVTIAAGGATSAIGFGVADSDPVSLTVEALGANGSVLGTFLINLATTESTVNTGNGYYVIGDTSADIYSLAISQSTGSADYSGLALDDVQVAAVTPVAATPEPGSITLLGLGLSGLATLKTRRRFKRAQ